MCIDVGVFYFATMSRKIWYQTYNTFAFLMTYLYSTNIGNRQPFIPVVLVSQRNSDPVPGEGGTNFG